MVGGIQNRRKRCLVGRRKTAVLKLRELVNVDNIERIETNCQSMRSVFRWQPIERKFVFNGYSNVKLIVVNGTSWYKLRHFHIEI